MTSNGKPIDASTAMQIVYMTFHVCPWFVSVGLTDDGGLEVEYKGTGEPVCPRDVHGVSVTLVKAKRMVE